MAESICRDAYVYAIEVDGVVRYIGKGKGDRASSHIRHAQKVIREKQKTRSRLYAALTRAIIAGSMIRTTILLQGLSDEEAYYREAVEIAKASTGQLWNMQAGGLGINSEDARKRWADPGAREKMRAAIKAARSTPEAKARASEHMRAARAAKKWGYGPSPLRGRKQSPEVRQILSAAAKRRAQRPGEREWRQEVARRPENIARLKTIGRISDPLVIAKARQGTARAWNDPVKQARMRGGLENGRKPESYTVERSRKIWADPESRRRYGEKMKANWADPEFRAKTIAAQRAARCLSQ